VNDADASAAPSPPRAPSRRRRLSDDIPIAFHSACDHGDFEAAARLTGILKRKLLEGAPCGRPARRTDIEGHVSLPIPTH
jgi:hypothetical protein